MDALRELMSGKFSGAVNGFERELLLDPDDIASVDGLSAACQGNGDYEKALPLIERVHAYQKAGNP